MRELMEGATRTEVAELERQARRIRAGQPASKVVHVDESELLAAAAATGRPGPKGRRVSRPRPPVEDEPEV